jgi:hypothetical protein
MCNQEVKRVFECENCGVSVRRPQRAEECPVCGERALKAVAYGSGYDEPHMLGIWARADMLERIGSMTLGEQSKELGFALAAADPDDPNTLRWAAVLIESRLGALAIDELRVKRRCRELEALSWELAAQELRDGELTLDELRSRVHDDPEALALIDRWQAEDETRARHE